MIASATEFVADSTRINIISHRLRSIGLLYCIGTQNKIAHSKTDFVAAYDIMQDSRYVICCQSDRKGVVIS
jgi:hypothetical protein